MIVRINTDINHSKISRLQYTIDFINSHPLVKSRMKLETCRGEDKDYLLSGGNGFAMKMVSNQYLFNKKDFKELPAPHLNSFTHEGKEITGISPEGKPQSSAVNDNTICFDVFETIFFFISRIEETILPQKEYIGRKEDFENQLLIIKSGKEKIPVVDHLICFLIEVLTGSETQQETVFTITHDIDNIQKFKSPLTIIKKIGGHFFHRKSIKGLSHLFRGYKEYLIYRKDPYETFEWMLLENENLEKHIYFLSGGRHPNDSPYNQDNEYFQSIIDLSVKRGYQIGIHPSYDSWNDDSIISNEKVKLESVTGYPINKSRQHFLNFDISITPGLLLKAGIKKDSSLGFTRHVGFRCGTGFPYHLYDFETESRSGLIEDPVVFMDTSCLHECNFDSSKYMDLLAAYVEQNSRNTRINFNFHNSFFDEAELRNIPLKKWYLEHFTET